MFTMEARLKYRGRERSNYRNSIRIGKLCNFLLRKNLFLIVAVQNVGSLRYSFCCVIFFTFTDFFRVYNFILYKIILLNLFYKNLNI